jgi:hypothetical protein
MACKITHRASNQQLRFANRVAAERYLAVVGSGIDWWEFTTVPQRASWVRAALR